MAVGGVISSAFGNSEIFFIAGVIFILLLTRKFLSFLLKFLYRYCLSSFLGLSTNIKNLGAWAVVTGATDGIGKAYAEQLAERGCNIVLISRSPEKLSTVSRHIETTYNVTTRVIVADFACDDIYDHIKADLAGLDVGILVNNVGISYDYPEFFLDLPNREQKIRDFLNVNTLAMTMMTNIVLPGMVAKKRGAIVNVSSYAAHRPVPLLAVYSATKAYVDYLSRALHAEYSSKGVTIQSVRPYLVTTKLSKIRRASLTIPSPDAYVRSALTALGLETSTAGYWSHSLLTTLTDYTPRWLYDRYVMFLHLGLRRRALKRKLDKGE